jgi:phosphate:Na+ symporter
LIASIPANRDSKRAAIFHITYDIIGSTVFGILIFIFPGILGWFQATWDDSARQVAMFHTLYNVATLVLLIPFVGWIAMLMQKIVPLKENENKKIHERKLMYLDANKSPTPAFATIHAHLEVCRMGKIVNENLALSIESFFEGDADKSERVFENEKTVDFLTHKITSQLILINNMSLSDIEAEKIGVMFKTLTDMERIGDHAKNIAGYTLAKIDGNLKLDEIAVDELRTLGNLAITISEKALDAYEREDKSLIPQVKSLEKEVDALSKQFVENHVERLKTEACEPKSGVMFTDMIIDLERTSDHAKNVAFSLIAESRRNKKINKKGEGKK